MPPQTQPWGKEIPMLEHFPMTTVTPWPRNFGSSLWRRLLISGLLAVGSLLTTGIAAGLAAEEIVLSYGLIERTISVKDLAAFTRGEPLSRQLTSYARSFGLSAAELAEIRAILNQSADFDVVAVAQFLYTPQGEVLLEALGDVIQTSSGQSGFSAIRAALILAAADEDQGLTLLNFLVKFPTPTLRVDLARGLDIAQTISNTLNQSNQATSYVQRSAQAVEALPAAELRQAWELVNAPFPYDSQRYPITIPIRRIRADLYLPTPRPGGRALPPRVPVVVVSHGLGDERGSYRYLGTYLSRRGLAVAILDHPGSNSQQIANLLAGRSGQVVDDREFINRPQDVSALLNALEVFANRDRTWRDRLDTQNVGIVGQSFGGYTALALAGAPLSGQSLETACGPQLLYLNPSLLLQCQASEIVTTPPSLKDDRVRAILVVNPIGSALFGEAGFRNLQLPIMIVAGSSDTVAPALPEQINPFSWLSAPERYLVLIQNATHFSVIANNPTGGNSSIPVPISVIGAQPELAQGYLQILSLAFFQRYLLQDDRYQPALTSQYLGEYVEKNPLSPLSLLRELSPLELQQALLQTGN